MEIEHLHQLIDEKKWTLIFHEFDHLLKDEDSEKLISIFESIDRKYREEHAQKYYFEMWKVAYKAGKIKLAKSYAEFVLDYLIELKRVPALKKLIAELSEVGLLKNHKKFHYINLILGKKTSFSLEDSECFEAHPELWKSSEIALKNYLMNKDHWSIEDWKLTYEYVLKFYYDKDLFLLLATHAIQMKKDEHKRNILNYLATKKVNLKQFEQKSSKEMPKKESNLHVDYDQLAMDVMSGHVEPSITEQKKILVSIQELSNEELLTKGKDMIVAFGLLGMDKVVVSLCEKVIPLLDDVKERAGIQFMMIQALLNHNEFHKVIDSVDDILSAEPLLQEELIAFNYLKAESFFKLKKYRLAKEIFLKIKKISPHYRLVGERLKNIEEIK